VDVKFCLSHDCQSIRPTPTYCSHLCSDLNRQFVDASALESEAAQQMAVLEVSVLRVCHFLSLWDFFGLVKLRTWLWGGAADGGACGEWAG
jgi:hypothetical protein